MTQNYNYDDAGACPPEDLMVACWRAKADEVIVIRVREHVEHCPTCRDRWDELAEEEEISVLLREARRETSPAQREQLIDSATTAIEDGDRRADDTT